MWFCAFLWLNEADARPVGGGLFGGLVLGFELVPNAGNAALGVGMPVGIDYVVQGDQSRMEGEGEVESSATAFVAVIVIEEDGIVFRRELRSQFRQRFFSGDQLNRLREMFLCTTKSFLNVSIAFRFDRRDLYRAIVCEKLARDMPLESTALGSDHE